MQEAKAETSPSPPLGAERARVRWGRLLHSAIMGAGMRLP